MKRVRVQIEIISMNRTPTLTIKGSKMDSLAYLSIKCSISFYHFVVQHWMNKIHSIEKTDTNVQVETFLIIFFLSLISVPLS